MDRQNKPDTIDWKILKELQGEGRISNVDLAGRVGLSPPPTLRRVQALEQEGYITGYRARLAAEKLGYGAQVIALVGLKSKLKMKCGILSGVLVVGLLCANAMRFRVWRILC